MNYVVFDVETTGLDFLVDNVIEISGVKVDECGTLLGEFHEIIYRSVRLSKTITDLTGITNDELATGKQPHDVFSAFHDFIRDCTLVGHNVGFDLEFLYKEIGEQNPSFLFYDTLTMSRVLLPWMRRHKLDLVCEEFGVILDNHHRSLCDARATMEIFLFLLKMARARKIDFLNTLSRRNLDENHTFCDKYLFLPNDLPTNFAS